MNRKLSCIMLIDDNSDDNFFHEREMKKLNLAITVITRNSGKAGLEYLKSRQQNNDPRPELIFLDINMPGINGWEFLHEYRLLDKGLQSDVVVIMLTTSDNPDDEAHAKKFGFVSDYLIKPMVKENIKGLIDKYFSGPEC